MINLLVENIILKLESFGSYCYLIGFLGAFFESMPFVGGIIPGNTIVIFTGVLAVNNILNLGITMFVVAIGAILGDCIGNFLGRKYGYGFLLKHSKYFFIKKEKIEESRSLFKKHGGKILVFGRFSPVLRAVMPFLSGALHMPLRQFYLYNTLGGLFWALISVGLGYTLGESYRLAEKYLLWFGLFIIVLGILAILYIKLIKGKNNEKIIGQIKIKTYPKE